MLVAGRIPGFGAGPYAVEDLRPVFQVEAQALEMVIPVGVLDDDLHLGIDLLGGTDHQVAAGFVHQFQAVLRPGLVPLGGNLDVLLAAGEEEVVQKELVEVTGRMLGDLLHHGAVVGVRVAEGLEIVGLVDGVGDAAGHLDALAQEEGLGLFKDGVVHQMQVSVGLQIDLIHVQLAGDGLPGGFEPLGVRHLFDLVRADVNGYFEVLVPGQERNCEKQRQDSGAEKAESVFHGY